MTSEADFLTQLAANRADTHTRLVYADWLDDNDRAREAAVQRVLAEPADDAHRLAFAAVCEREGDADRAGFVRGQLAGAPLRLSSGRVWEWFVPWWGRRTYTNVYLVRGGLAVRNGHQPYESREGFIVRRGFVAEVTCAAADWLANGDAICEAHPVLRVAITEMSGWDARLAQLDSLAPDGTFGCSRWPRVAFEVPRETGFAPGTVTYTGHEPPVQHADGSFEVTHNFTVAPGG